MKRLATLILLLAGAACLAVLGYALLRTASVGQALPVGFYALPSIGAAMRLGALLLRAESRMLLAVCLIAALVSVYGAEIYLTYAPGDPGEAASAARGLEHDPRSRLEVVRDLRADGVAAFPFVHPALLLAPPEDGVARSVIRIDGEEVLPVGGIGGVVTVVCREAGGYLAYEADRHGFHNPSRTWPPGTWTGPVGRARILAIGDSFAQGQCAPDGQGLVARLRAAEPATVSLGAGHNGPLLTLAALREFARTLRPDAVIWLYYEGNDLLIDLPREAFSPLLMRYLDPAFDQNLANRQAAIDAALSAYADEQLVAAATEERDARRRRLLGIAKLRGLRRLFGATAPAPPPDLALFGRVLARARDDIRGWGGRMVFVYLPSWNTLFRPTDSLTRLRADVLDITRSLDLPVIDLVPAFEAAADGTALFYYPGSHYSPEGHALAARTIEAVLETADVLR